MSKSKSKAEISKPLCSAEQAINAANWDKYSTWEILSSKMNIKPWPEGKIVEARTSQK
jgi:hypothetical protein